MLSKSLLIGRSAGHDLCSQYHLFMDLFCLFQYNLSLDIRILFLAMRFSESSVELRRVPGLPFNFTGNYPMIAVFLEPLLKKLSQLLPILTSHYACLEEKPPLCWNSDLKTWICQVGLYPFSLKVFLPAPAPILSHWLKLLYRTSSRLCLLHLFSLPFKIVLISECKKFN